MEINVPKYYFIYFFIKNLIYSHGLIILMIIYKIFDDLTIRNDHKIQLHILIDKSYIFLYIFIIFIFIIFTFIQISMKLKVVYNNSELKITKNSKTITIPVNNIENTKTRSFVYSLFNMSVIYIKYNEGKKRKLISLVLYEQDVSFLNRTLTKNY